MLASAPHLSERIWFAKYPRDVPTHLEYPPKPLFWFLEEAAARSPNRIACRYYRQELTYSRLLEQSQRMAAALRARGLQPGDRVGLLMPNIPDYVIALFGTWMAGGVAVPINPLLVGEEVTALRHLTNCRFVVCLDLLLHQLGPQEGEHPDVVFVTSLADRLPRFASLAYKFARLRRLGWFSRRRPPNAQNLNEALASAQVGELPRTAPDAPALIMPTGGTTGWPKAVLLTHQNLVANAWQLLHWTDRRFDENTILACLPFFHIYGLTTCVLSGVAMGATLVLHHRFQTEKVLKLIERWRPTLVPVVPAMLVAFNKVLRKRHYDLHSIRSVISGGAALNPDVAAEFSRHSGATVVEGYGLSEASPVTHAGPLDGTARPATIGLPMPDTDAMIVDANTGAGPLPYGEVGELVVRGPQVMAGYWNEPEATARAIRDGWLYTGDLAECSSDGFFKIVDRKKDLIITNGVNVYPTDVEHVLHEFDGIEDVAVIGVPDEQHGELVKALVVVKDGAPFDRRAFDAFARAHLEVHKRPRIVEVVPGPLPRTALGKLLRRIIRDKYGDPGDAAGLGTPTKPR
jgi:long-chain acyl-CoA synthetase